MPTPNTKTAVTAAELIAGTNGIDDLQVGCRWADGADAAGRSCYIIGTELRDALLDQVLVNQRVVLDDGDLVTPGTPLASDAEAYASANGITANCLMIYPNNGTNADPEWCCWFDGTYGTVIRDDLT